MNRFHEFNVYSCVCSCDFFKNNVIRSLVMDV
jgi:hypothetical protein